MRYALGILLLLIAQPARDAVAEEPVETQNGIDFFEARIRPVLVKHCYDCHSVSSGTAEGGLRVDSRKAIRAGGKHGPAVVPGKPLAGSLLKAVRHSDRKLKMPPDQKRLPKSVIADLTAWITMGAPDPREEKTGSTITKADRTFWAYQPVKATATPQVANTTWPKRSLDNFVLAKLKKNGLAPSADATPQILLRRLHFDLVGFTTLSAVGSARQLVSQLLTRYDTATVVGADGTTTKDGNLSRKELGFEQESFQPFDADENGTLDFDEMMQFVRRPSPAVEFIVRLGKRESGEKLVELISSAKELQAGIRTSSAGLVTVVLGETQIEIGANQQWSQVSQNESYYKVQFAAADTDNNAYLEKKEVERNGFFRNKFALMDRDGDGKVFVEEVQAFAKRIFAAASSSTVLNVSNAGRNLFEILDLNRDRRLGRRELTAAVERMELWDADGDKHVAEAELPTHFRLTLGRTQVGGVGVIRTSPTGMLYSTTAAGNSSRPLWFQKMDRNQDGDISRREFLGPRKKFQTLDKDSDGLIDPNEAALAK